jgi:GT2 family glycosyltransferase
MTPLLSIVTGTRNRPESLLRLLNSIQSTVSCSCEVVVADASDVPLNPSQFPPMVRILREYPRLGCTKGYNVAFRACVGKWVMWLNDDCELLPGCADTAVAFMESHTIGLGALYYAEGIKPFKVNSYWDMVYANFGIIKRDLGNAIGWFDEDFPMYGCDNSLAFKVLLNGFGIDGIPDARVVHHAIDDDERRENNDPQSRIREAEQLRDKYAPFVKEMQRVYRVSRSGQCMPPQDQTPQWMWPQVTL